MSQVTTQKMNSSGSPFSMSSDIYIEWSALRTNIVATRDKMFRISTSDRFMEMCKDLSIVKVISSVQLKKYSSQMTNRNAAKTIQSALKQGLILKHLLKRDNREIPIYTLGPLGLQILEGLNGKRIKTDWQSYSKHQILQSLAFYHLYFGFRENGFELDDPIEDSPFIAKLGRGDKSFNVIVVKGNENEINSFFQHEDERVPERIILIVENINHLEPLQRYIKPYLNRIRVTLDHHGNFDSTEFKDQFYKYNGLEWVKDSVK